MPTAELEEIEVLEDEVLDTEEVDEEVDNDQVDEIEANADESPETDEESSVVEEDESDDIEITLDGASLTPDVEEEKSAPAWVKEVRKNYKDAKKENEDLKRRIAEFEQLNAKSDGEKPRAKPTLEDFDYDQDAFEVAMVEHLKYEQEVQKEELAKQEQVKRQQQEWQETVNAYEAGKTKLKVKDYEEAEMSAFDMLDQTQQGMIIQGSDNPALTIYAIGKNTKVAQELADIKDPVKFAFAVSKMEGKLKMGKRKAKPAPEATVKGGGGGVGKDHTLERLQKEADKTGDRSKIFAYRKKLREQRNK